MSRSVVADRDWAERRGRVGVPAAADVGRAAAIGLDPRSGRRHRHGRRGLRWQRCEVADRSGTIVARGSVASAPTSRSCCLTVDRRRTVRRPRRRQAGTRSGWATRESRSTDRRGRVRACRDLEWPAHRDGISAPAVPRAVPGSGETSRPFTTSSDRRTGGDAADLTGTLANVPSGVGDRGNSLQAEPTPRPRAIRSYRQAVPEGDPRAHRRSRPRRRSGSHTAAAGLGRSGAAQPPTPTPPAGVLPTPSSRPPRRSVTVAPCPRPIIRPIRHARRRAAGTEESPPADFATGSCRSTSCSACRSRWSPSDRLPKTSLPPRRMERVRALGPRWSCASCTGEPARRDRGSS